VRAPPTTQADGGAASPSQLGYFAMLRAQRRRETVTEGGWAELLDELLAKVLELLQEAGRGGFGFSRASATVRRCGWCALVEGRARCAGDAAGAETRDHAGAAKPGGGDEERPRRDVGVDGPGGFEQCSAYRCSPLSTSASATW
jgi:hypothetical protein